MNATTVHPRIFAEDPSQSTEAKDRGTKWIAEDEQNIQEIRDRISKGEIPDLTTLKAKHQEMRKAGEDIDTPGPTTLIEEGLYLGIAREAGDIPEDEDKEMRNQVLEIYKNILKEDWKVKTIVRFQSNSRDYPKLEGFDYKTLIIGDTENNETFMGHLLTVFQLFKEARSEDRAIFLCCSGGVSRSPSFAISILMLLGMPFNEAHLYLTDKRPNINIENFRKDLETLNLNIDSYRREFLGK